jgi:hypothetical protein
VFGRKRVRLPGVLGQTYQFPIAWTVDPLGIGEGFGKILLGEAEELFLVDFLSLLVAHCRVAESVVSPKFFLYHPRKRLENAERPPFQRVRESFLREINRRHLLVFRVTF